MLCKILGVHGGDYEECRLLEYKKPVRTSQETHYVSVTEPSRLMLCKILGVHGGDYEECRLRDVTSCGSCKNRRFEGTFRLYPQGETVSKPVTANSPSWLILFTLMIEAKPSYETSVLTTATRRRIPEDGIILHLFVYLHFSIHKYVIRYWAP
jgi:hypothetical protein